MRNNAGVAPLYVSQRQYDDALRREEGLICEKASLTRQWAELRDAIGTEEDCEALRILNLQSNFQILDAVGKMRAGLVRYHGDSERAEQAVVEHRQALDVRHRCRYFLFSYHIAVGS